MYSNSHFPHKIFPHTRFLFLILIFVSGFGFNAYSQITGTVFRDFNGNGTKESAEPLIAGVEVKAYNTAGAQCGTTQTTTSASAPNYSLSGCTGAVRVEFSIPATGCQLSNGVDYSGLSGSAYGSSVQFLANAAAASRTANFALSYPGEYGGPDTAVPDVYSTAQFSGNPLLTGTTATQTTVYKSAYTAAGTVGSTTLANRQVGLTALAKNAQTGSIWGMVHSKQAQRIFVSAMIKRHAGMGPAGPGGIYMINPTTPDLVGNITFVSLDALGFPTHAAGTYGAGSPLTIGSNADRGLPANAVGVPTRDQFAYDQVGKTSLGDIELSEDGRYLFVTNLYDRKLYRIDLQNASSPVTPTAAQVTSYSIPNPCTGTNAGEPRPWALKVHRGKILTGVVCSGQTAANAEVGTSATMSANVLEFDLNTLSYNTTPIHTQNLSYRDPIVLQYNIAALNVAWGPWMDTWSTNNFLFGGWAPGQSAIVSSQPIVADIEFDADGNMILGLLDRHGHQTGSANYDLNGTGSYSKAFAQGDNLHLTKSATCTYSSTAVDYYDDCVKWGNNDTSPPYGNNCDHNEIFFGSLASHRFGDKDELVTSSLNPVYQTSNGYMIVNNDNGSQVRANEIWFDPNWPNSAQTVFGKAAGIGDMELLGVPSPIEIGNRVWLDTDNDGVQDAGEAGISGVTVELRKGATVLATATTDTNGNYYFSSATGTDTASIKYGLTQLMPNMAYTVRFPTTTTVTATTYNLTTANAGTNNFIDSDAAASGDISVLTTDIPISGANNHTFDVGYSAAPVCAINTPTIATTCNDNGTPAITTDDTFTFTISATGTGVGATYKVDKTAPAPTTTPFASVNYGATSAASSAFPISGGNLTLTLTDNTTATCTLANVNVPAPVPCSTPPTGQPDLELVKTASAASVVSGNTLTYTLTLRNTGTVAATGVQIRDLLPAGLTYVSSVPAQGTYTAGTGLWNVGTVATGATLTLTITVTVN